ncbi:2-oxoglutarate dehydrogenase complex dihydrolipoyllysine-residue succinyltransferase [Sphingosinicella microcystinivorans]|uniref:Dihydrolipoyllysine-residue succinyltransferase component of 2-oxoglutarate dehydrogenase complex n=1 Tax=Sphingosinicella microcystinivorans TaxID=335406 RepID=A0AAD1D6Q5_SPHMI|nr:2-oxoglutarate dehydrogenase complex dihydrolipoyllysine-residue succinyltransferase [Sphingosinicella microcystinivorans]RKS91595.1 2-oxoglutarate dehydrogenase E2 component [Sphingosinicella microcystinivorans]BBE34575.1 dihydrolipoyllysine-residue succinyltransferase component of 2-oxoglutarate dehydrogenase complex [Sphingosinicella microcystinivorans]
MAIDVVIPALGESITEATVGEWLKKPGDAVKADEPIVSLETDKVAVEVPAPSAGVLSEQLAAVGDTVNVGAVIARLEAGAAAAAPKTDAKAAEPAKAAAPAKADAKQSPAVTVALAETGVDAASVQGTGKDGRLTKGDVRTAAATPVAAPAASAAPAAGGRQEERVRMTRLRQTIARRLKEAQNTAAMLTTFNDVDMTAVMEARDRYKDMFEKKHGVRLGFMSFFTKACCLALKDVPSVNATIEGDEIVYRNYADIGVAVSSPGGLVVPILRNADTLSFAETEKAIGDFGRRARDGQLKIEELQGGTFTISNGGVFGSLLSTPILNPPQSGVLGMHRIEERPVVRDGQIVVRPMMYLALSYDHRLIDGREAVTFLVRVKEALEDPTRLVLDL